MEKLNRKERDEDRNYFNENSMGMTKEGIHHL